MKSVLTISISLLFIANIYSQSNESEWTYEGESGPDNWADLDEHFLDCGGEAQSPVDILHAILEVNSKPLVFEYSVAEIDFWNNGHTVEEIIHEPNHVMFDGVKYTLEQFHFHTPSEHKIDHHDYPMEMHFVHKDSNGDLLVIAVLVKQGEKLHPALDLLEHFVPKNTDDEIIDKTQIDVNLFLPDSKEFFHYGGSLTTPPCTEGVRWVVMEESIEATFEQIDEIHQIIKDDNRPVQALKGRHVYSSH